MTRWRAAWNVAVAAVLLPWLLVKGIAIDPGRRGAGPLFAGVAVLLTLVATVARLDGMSLVATLGAGVLLAVFGLSRSAPETEDRKLALGAAIACGAGVVVAAVRLAGGF